MPATFTDEGMKLLWIPDGTTITGTIAALKVADFAATGVLDLSDFAIVGGCEFVAAPSDTVDRKVYSDIGKNTVPTTKNYTGKGQFERSRDVGGVVAADDVLKAFDNRQLGHIIKRLGLPEATAAATGQDYEYFRFRADHVATMEDAGGGKEYIEVGFLPAGSHGFGVVATGA